MGMMRISFAAALLCAALAGGCGDGPRPAESAPQAAPDRTDDVLILAIAPELPPYAFVNTNSGDICGIDVDIVKAAAARLRRPLRVVKLRFDALLPAVRDLKADFAAGAITVTPGRRHDVEFSIPYVEEGSVFLYRAGETVPTMVRAEGMRIGAVESMTQDFYLTRHGIDPFRYPTVDAAVADLKAHKVDAVFYDRPILASVAAASGGQLAVTPLETRESYGIAIRKDRTDYIEAVNAVIRPRGQK